MRDCKERRGFRVNCYPLLPPFGSPSPGIRPLRNGRGRLRFSWKFSASYSSDHLFLVCGLLFIVAHGAIPPVHLALMKLNIGRKTSKQAESRLGAIPLDLPTHTFKLLNKSSDFLKHTLLFGQVLRIKRAHLGQNGIELSAIVTGELTF